MKPTQKSSGSNIRVGKLIAHGNGGAAVRTSGEVNLDIGSLVAIGNGEDALSIDAAELKPVQVERAVPDPWYKRPIGMVGIGLVTAVLAAVAKWLLQI